MSLVYFMRRADGVGPIKIGCSKWPVERITAFQHWSPEILGLAASAPGDFRDEQRLHRQFASTRLHGEWFEATPELLSVVAKVHASGKLPPAPADDRAVRIIAAYGGGATLQQIGDDFGITRERVRQILRRHDVPSLGWRPDLLQTSVAAKSKARVLALAGQGHTVPAIAVAVGDSRQNVLNVLRREGVTAVHAKKGRAQKTLAKADVVARMYRDGERIGDIAKTLGTYGPSIYRLLRIAGCEPDRKPSCGNRRGHAQPESAAA
jgi:hypothetical protein